MDMSQEDKNELLKYFEDLESALKCRICGKIADDPQVFSNCHHFFCKSCIDYGKNNCTVCDVPSFAKDIVPDNFIANVKASALNIKRILFIDKKTTDQAEKAKPCLEENVSKSKSDSRESRAPKDLSRKSSQKPFKEGVSKLSHKDLSNTGIKQSGEPSKLTQVSDPKELPRKSSQKHSKKGVSKLNHKDHSNGDINQSVEPPKLTRVSDPKELPLKSSQKPQGVSKLNRKDHSNRDINQSAEPSKLTWVSDPKELPRKSSQKPSKEGVSKLNHKDHSNRDVNQSAEPPKLTRVSDTVNRISKPPKSTHVLEPAKQKSDRNSGDRSKDGSDNIFATPAKKVKRSTSDDRLPTVPSQSTKKAANKRNTKGETPLHVACIKGNASLVKTSIDDGANPNVKDNFGWTPLHEAIYHKRLDIAKLLLERGRAWVNTPGGENITPLHKVAVLNWFEGAKLLLEWGANPQLMDIYGRKPIDLTTSVELMKIMENSLTGPRKCSFTNPILSDINEQEDHITFFGDDLSKDDQKLLAKLSSIIPASKLVNKFSPDVSHIVVNVKNGVCDPTINVLVGILTGKLIVSMHWVEHSIKIGGIKHHHSFGVRGTKNYPESNGIIKARLSSKIMLPSLFSGLHFSISPLFRNFKYENLKKEDLINLVILGSGRYLSRQPDPEAIPTSEMTVPFYANNSVMDFIDGAVHSENIISSNSSQGRTHYEEILNQQLGINWRKCLSGVDEAHPLKKCCHVILYHEENNQRTTGGSQNFVKYNMSHLKALPIAWFIGCIESFTLLDPSSFH